MIHIIVHVALDGKRFYDHFEAGENAPSGMSGERTGTDSLQPTLGAMSGESDRHTISTSNREFNPDIRRSTKFRYH